MDCGETTDFCIIANTLKSTVILLRKACFLRPVTCRHTMYLAGLKPSYLQGE